MTLIGRDPDDAADLTEVRGAITRGRDAKAGERGVAVVGSELARLLQIDAGNLIGLPSPRDDAPALRVIGLFDSPVSLYTSDVVLADARDVRALLDVPDGVATDRDRLVEPRRGVGRREEDRGRVLHERAVQGGLLAARVRRVRRGGGRRGGGKRSRRRGGRRQG